MSWFWFGANDDEAHDMEDYLPPFWETDVVELGERERRKANYYEGLQPLWPRLGQLMVRVDAPRERFDARARVVCMCGCHGLR
jgi:hypothetical protein